MYTSAVELKETYTNSEISEMNTILIKEKPEQMSGMNVNYLTVGVGAIISMLLFVITIQLCKNSKSAKRKKSTEQKGYCSQVGYESSIQIQHSGDGEYKTISLSTKMVNLCRTRTTCTIKSTNAWSWCRLWLFQI